jgi:hypothetical protein
VQKFNKRNVSLDSMYPIGGCRVIVAALSFLIYLCSMFIGSSMSTLLSSASSRW